MNPKKKQEDKKVKFTICVNPLIYKKMEIELINKSKLIENLLKSYYDKKNMS
jgi:hypothetical protein